MARVVRALWRTCRASSTPCRGNEPLCHEGHGRALRDPRTRPPALRMAHTPLRRPAILRGDQELRKEEVRGTQFPQRSHGLGRDARGMARAVLEERGYLQTVDRIVLLLAYLRAAHMLDLDRRHGRRRQAEPDTQVARGSPI